MIVTVTMNPAIDKTIDVAQLERGGLNRISHMEYDAGGKGINVSKTISALGGTSIATGFLAGSAGAMIQNLLSEWNITTDFVKVSGETRTNTKVFEQSGVLTELNEPGPEIKKEEKDQLLAKLDQYATSDTLFVLAGSIPVGISTDIYKEITEMVHAKGSKVLLDADGVLFTQSLIAGPDMIKPNRVELEQYMQIEDGATESELLAIAKELKEQGIDTIAVSMGKSGALFLHRDLTVRCPGLNVKAHSTVGAGDAMVAALAFAYDTKMQPVETVKLAVATSAGAVTTIGTKPPTKELIIELIKQVEIEQI